MSKTRKNKKSSLIVYHCVDKNLGDGINPIVFNNCSLFYITLCIFHYKISFTDYILKELKRMTRMYYEINVKKL